MAISRRRPLHTVNGFRAHHPHQNREKHDQGSPFEWSGITEDRYRVLFRRGHPQLYDLRNDPGELIDLAESDPERIKSMIRRYLDFMKQLPDLEEVEGVDLPLDEESRRALEALGYLNPEPDES